MQSRLIGHPSKILNKIKISCRHAAPREATNRQSCAASLKFLFIRLHKRFFIIEGKLSGH